MPSNGSLWRAPTVLTHAAIARRPSSSATRPPVAEHLAGLRVGRVHVFDLEALGHVARFERHLHHPADVLGQLVERHRVVGPDVEDLVVCLRPFDHPGDGRRHVRDVAKRPGLVSVAEDRDWLAAKDPVHEDADDVAIAIADVLPLAVHVVRSDDHERHVEGVAAGPQILLDGGLGESRKDRAARSGGPR